MFPNVLVKQALFSLNSLPSSHLLSCHRSHKLDYKQHQSVDQEKFRISANGGKVFDNAEANQVGNYNVLLNACPANVWDSEKMTWEGSHDAFHDAFAAFPWEVLEVFSGPPKVAFTWRHWGHYTGAFENKYKGSGELIEMYGFGTAVVNDKLQLQDVEIYYNAQEFIDSLRGEKKPGVETNANWKSAGCPFTAMAGLSSSSSSSRDEASKPRSLLSRLLKRRN